MQYNAALGACPNCGTKLLAPWRRVIGWRWPLPLAIGLALQVLSQHTDPDRRRPELPRLPEVALISQFIAGVLIFSAVAALLLFAIGRTRIALRRRNGRRRRRASRGPSS